MKKIYFLLLFVFCFSSIKAEDGYRLWLRYDLIANPQVLVGYKQLITGVMFGGNSSTINAAKEELEIGLRGLLGKDIPVANDLSEDGILIVGTPKNLNLISIPEINDKLKNIGDEGYIIVSTSINNKKATIISANEDVGVLYGVFNFLRLLQTHQSINALTIESSPKIKVRILNHWDNLDRTIERGYAGFSIWDWHRLPDYIDPRYKDYARANASVGINGASITNVNANSLVLRHDYLLKAAALANVFRPYGIKVYLTARFSSPIELGGLKTADPFEPEVKEWWKNKVKEIYELIPDFGGFLVKANSEGQPGPQNYKRDHADGANMLADALKPYNGVVMWRAFVYDNNVPDDRHKQAYNEFVPIDEKFRSNVLIQAKNGAIDFQPREPFHPLFGGLKKTQIMMEFQITMEYLGQATSLVYLAPMYEECLDSDTYAKGKGSTVAKVIDGSLDKRKLTGIAGVANTGTDRNWTGHLFLQSNWYVFGRLAWDNQLSSGQLADEWIRMTFSNDESFINPVKSMMMNSREAVVNYMTPLGLHHLMGWDHHYGPGPWVKMNVREDWNPPYYHRADEEGLGFDRTSTGSNAVAQYHPPVKKMFESLETCPEEFLLWFHHVQWDYKMKSGRTLWAELCYKYYEGVDTVRSMQKTWDLMKGKIDKERFEHVKMLLTVQEKESVLWRDACVLYFQTFSKQPIPGGLEIPANTLEYYKSLTFPYAPGIKPQWK